MKILVDRDRCEGNARCVQEAPAVFAVDDREQLQVLLEEPGPEHKAAVEAAVARCPRQALQIDDD
ncbi:MAG TPA: ferredoxin [Kofleriaceae bacterium]|nr:ferredoxin [Kofleriaceae bacterium]